MLTRLASYVRRHHVGLLALFVALSGTAYAATLPRNSVGTAQLKTDAVTTKKVKDRSLLANDFKRGQLPAGPRGAQGLAGPTGPAGPVGPTGPSGGVEKFVIRGGGPGSDQAFCQGGEVAVGGGGNANPGFLYQSQPLPFAVDVAPVGWQVGAEDVDGSPVFTSAWVVCAS
jgi:hypothetical protein